MSTFLVFKKVYTILALNFQHLLPSMTVLKNDREKFEAALRKHLNTHSFYCEDELFMCKDDL